MMTFINVVLVIAVVVLALKSKNTREVTVIRNSSPEIKASDLIFKLERMLNRTASQEPSSIAKSEVLNTTTSKEVETTTTMKPTAKVVTFQEVGKAMQGKCIQDAGDQKYLIETCKPKRVQWFEQNMEGICGNFLKTSVPDVDPIDFALVVGREQGHEESNHGEDVLAEFWILFKSIVGLSSLPVRFHILTDPSTKKVLDTLQNDERVTKARVPVTFVIVGKTNAEITKWIIESGVEGNELLKHHSGIFGASKLYLHWAFPDLDTGLFVDTDMAFVVDPAKLWELRKRDNPQQLLKMILHTHIGKQKHQCSCIMMMFFDRLRKPGYKGLDFNNFIKHILKRKPPNGDGGWYSDQDVYAAFWEEDKNLVGNVDIYWNRENCQHYYGVEFDPSEAGIYHDNCLIGDLQEIHWYRRMLESAPWECFYQQ